MSITTLGLELPTDPRWVNIAAMNLGEILTDHAFCEQKAASSCISLIVQYSTRAKIVETLTPIVAEEWGHFQRVLKEMRKRGLKLGNQRKDEYVNALYLVARQKGSDQEVLLDKLLLCALIEARSCERFKLLSENLGDPDLCRFYRELMISEAGHYHTFIDLAESYIPKEQVRIRWKELLAIESGILKNIALRGDRMH